MLECMKNDTLCQWNFPRKNRACGFDKKPLFKPFFFVIGSCSKGGDARCLKK
jgi:hypothetical protein